MIIKTSGESVRFYPTACQAPELHTSLQVPANLSSLSGRSIPAKNKLAAKPCLISTQDIRLMAQINFWSMQGG